MLFSLLPRKSQVFPASFLQLAESKEVGGVGSAQNDSTILVLIVLQANIRVVPSDSAYPSVEAMMADMQSRRDVAENLVHCEVTPIFLI